MKHSRPLLSVLALLLVIAVIFGVITVVERAESNRQAALLQEKAAQLSQSLWTDENTISIDGDTLGFDHRLETFLFVGTDLSGGQQIGSSDLRRQPMADFILLMVLDHTRNSIGYLQIDRNTITPVNALDEKGAVVGTRPLQICTAHWYGGTQEMAVDNLSLAVRHYLGDLENIDGYYVISMRDIELLNNAVGGVDITLSEDLTDADPEFTKGATLHLTDEQAERYLRARMDLPDATNAARMTRQRTYMTALFASVRQKCVEDPQFALSLWNTLRSAAFTNMNGNDFSRIAQKLIKGENQGIRTVEGETVEGLRIGDGIPHEEFTADTDSLKEQLIQLFSLVPVDVPEEDGGEEDDEEDEEDAEPEDPDDVSEALPDDPDGEEDDEDDGEEIWIEDEPDEEDAPDTESDAAEMNEEEKGGEPQP